MYTRMHKYTHTHTHTHTHTQGKELAVPCGSDGKAGELTKRLFQAVSDIHYGRKDEHGWSVVVE
jgi:hypothetical protein